MKTYQKSLRQLLPVIAAGALSCSLSQAASLSPVGQWDCLSSGGGQKGIAFIEFTANPSTMPGTYELQGYELLSSTHKTPSTSARGVAYGRGDTNSTGTSTNYIIVGFTRFDGCWSYDIKSNIIGYLYFDVVDTESGETNVNAVSFNGKVSGKAPNQKLSLLASSDYGKVTYKGLPLIAVTNSTGMFDGAWNGVKKQNGQFFQEFFSLDSYTPFSMANIYYMDGSGPGYTYANGICMISRQKQIGFALHEQVGTNYLNRASIGSFKAKSSSASTKGSVHPYTVNDVIKFDANRTPTAP